MGRGIAVAEGSVRLDNAELGAVEQSDCLGVDKRRVSVTPLSYSLTAKKPGPHTAPRRAYDTKRLKMMLKRR